MSKQTLYDTLQVSPSAEHEVIKAAYYRLARKYHPDTNPSAEAVLIMQRLNEAYAVLMNPEKRLAYDQQMQTPVYGSRLIGYGGQVRMGQQSYMYRQATYPRPAFQAGQQMPRSPYQSSTPRPDNSRPAFSSRESAWQPPLARDPSDPMASPYRDTAPQERVTINTD